MLIEFSVGNYRSFHKPVVLSLLATRLRSLDKEIDSRNVFRVGKIKLLRSAAIYGANASGKSNLIQAILFMRRFVLGSSTKLQAGEPTGVQRFLLNTQAQHQPAYFQIIFFLDEVRYRYGFELDEQCVRSEWLYQTKQRETRLFVRETDRFEVTTSFRKSTHLLEKYVRSNALFLSVLAQFNHPLAIELVDWFRNRLRGISGIMDDTYAGFTLQQFETDETVALRIRNLIRFADLGILDLGVRTLSLDDLEDSNPLRKIILKIKNGEPSTSEVSIKSVETIHQRFDGKIPAGQVKFDLSEHESEGTKKFFYLLGPILDSLDKGNVLVVDEFEARLHPVLSREMIRLFNSPTTNPKNAQLIFTTHDASLLGEGMLRRDQIWFTEKNRYGETELYSLAEMKERNDASFEKNYIHGRYGAIPLIGGMQAVFEQRGTDDPHPQTEWSENQR
ncbi:MAG: abortive infection protein [Anaerolineae bacterium]|jgi:AAA15 family ATPase/GTPase|nr:MAG: abortive infection protein [Anaerolineae bacterium]